MIARRICKQPTELAGSEIGAPPAKRSPAPPYFLMQISPSLSNVIARWTTAHLLAIVEIERQLNV